MITTAYKSFALSLTFHALMGSLAFWVLTQMNQPPHIERIPFKITSIQPSEHHIVIPVPKALPAPLTEPLDKAVPTPLKPVNKPPITQTPAAQPVAQQPAPIQTPVPTAAPIPKAIITPQPNAATVPILVQKPEIKPDNASEKRALLASLRSTIQNNLRYPSAARRRGIEGELGVRFTLNDSGSIGSISILSGDSIFHTAAKAAVASATGINIPRNLSDSLPMEIDLTLEFKLKE